MRLLHRLHREQRAVGLVVVAVKRERLLLAIGGAQVVHELERRRLAEIVVDAERREVAGRDAGHQAAFEAAAGHLVDDGDFFGEPQRMMQRHDEAHRADAQPFGARIAGDRVERGRRHPAFVGAEMVLDAEAVVEAELVAELELAPELLVALMRGHAGLAPDMGEVGEFHSGARSCRALLVGSFSMPVRSIWASASAMRIPAMRRSGAISASGISTKARSSARGCGRVSSACVERHAVIGDQVDIERARTPALLARAVAPELASRPSGRGPAAPAAKASVVGDDRAIDERRLVGDAPGRRAVVGRARDELDGRSVAQRRDGAVERFAHIPDIAAERDQRFSHLCV